MAKMRFKTAMHAWMREASTEQQIDLARRAGTSRAYLYMLGNGHRAASPALAAEIERVTAEMYKETGGRLQRLYRTDLAHECRGCEFARRCLGPIVERADFAFIDSPGDSVSGD